MRKRIIDQFPKAVVAAEPAWLDLANIASVEISSEDESYPIESALQGETEIGWRASRPSEQVIRLLFDEPQQIKQIKLVFAELEKARTQEFVLRWSRQAGPPDQEILRQQYNFSPPDTVRQSEIYTVNLEGVTALELSIVPDISGGNARASLACLRLA